MDRVSPDASVPRGHGKAFVQSPVLETNTSPGGVGKATSTPSAGSGPLFVTTIEYEKVVPRTTMGGLLAIEIATSATLPAYRWAKMPQGPSWLECHVITKSPAR